MPRNCSCSELLHPCILPNPEIVLLFSHLYISLSFLQLKHMDEN